MWVLTADEMKGVELFVSVPMAEAGPVSTPPAVFNGKKPASALD